MIACGSRKSIITLGVGVIFLFAVHGSEKLSLKNIVRISVIVLLLIIVIPKLGSITWLSGISERMSGLLASVTGVGDVDHSTLLRQEYVAVGLEVFKENPVFGIGIGNAHLVNIQDVYLHNNYVELLADGGIIGFLIYYSIYAYLLWQIHNIGWLKSESNHVILALMIILLISDFSLVSYYSKSTYFYFLIFFLGTENEQHFYETDIVAIDVVKTEEPE